MSIGDIYIGSINKKIFKIEKIQQCEQKENISILCEGKIFNYTKSYIDYLIKKGGLIKENPGITGV